jgi:formate hydrogenlyase transcriptional activator
MNKPIDSIHPDSLKLLTEHHWPGNVRELENLIERAMIVSSGDTLHIDPGWLEPARTASGSRPSSSTLSEMERQAILDALERCRGRIYGAGGAAAALGVKPTTLYGKMRRHRISKPSLQDGPT